MVGSSVAAIGVGCFVAGWLVARYGWRVRAALRRAGPDYVVRLEPTNVPVYVGRDLVAAKQAWRSTHVPVGLAIHFFDHGRPRGVRRGERTAAVRVG